MWVLKFFIHTWLILLFSKHVVGDCVDTNTTTTMYCWACTACTDEEIEKGTAYDGGEDWFYTCYETDHKTMYMGVCKISFGRFNYPHEWSKKPEYIENVRQREQISMKEEEWLPVSKGWQCTLFDREDPKEYYEECICGWDMCNKKYPPCKDRKMKNGKFCTR